MSTKRQDFRAEVPSNGRLPQAPRRGGNAVRRAAVTATTSRSAFMLESLEDRRLMAAIGGLSDWSGAGGGLAVGGGTATPVPPTPVAPVAPALPTAPTTDKGGDVGGDGSETPTGQTPTDPGVKPDLGGSPTPTPTPTPTPVPPLPVPDAPPTGNPGLPPVIPGQSGPGTDVAMTLKFLLVNADTGTTVTELRDGMTVDLATLPTRRLAIVVEASSSVSRVRFGLDGVANFNLESAHNFSLGGDNPNQNYRPNAYIPGLGSHVLSATPINKNGATGPAETIRFTFIDTNPQAGVPQFGFPDLGVRPITPPTYLPGQPAPARPVYVPLPAQTNTPGNALPTAELVTAYSGTFAGPGYFVIRANVSDPENRIAAVEFYANGQLIDGTPDAPWLIQWSGVDGAGVQPGSYQVTARVIDRDGGESVSAPMTFNIVAPPAGQTIVVNPGQSIDDAARQAEPGDTVVVRAGTYYESVELENGGTQDRPITFLFEDGAQIDARGRSGAFRANGGEWIIVKGMDVVGCDNQEQGQNAAVFTGDGWRLEDVTVTGVKMTGIGVKGDGVTLLRVVAADNGQNGISSPGGDFVLMMKTIIRHNNVDEHNPGGEGGGGKWARTGDVYITELETYDNIGPGLWFDINNYNFVVTRSVLHNNRGLNNMWEGDGVKSEINMGPGRIEYNLTYDNDGGGIDINETQDITVTGNVLVNDTLELRNYLRDDGPWKLENVYIFGNRFVNSYVNTSQAGERFGSSTGREWNILIDKNIYENAAGDPLFRWGGQNYEKVQELQNQLGFEQSSAVI